MYSDSQGFGDIRVNAGTGVVYVTGYNTHYIARFVPTPVTGTGPNSGPGPGGTSVTITGTGFTGAMAVNDSTSITAESPAGSGKVHITIVSPSGTSTLIQMTSSVIFLR